MNDKFCIDCEFVVIHRIAPPFCRHPSNGIDKVNGGIRTTLALTARSDAKLLFPDWDMCGVAGKHWKQKQVQVTIEVKPWWRFWK